MTAPTFRHACNGWSAGINSAEFYTCNECGACIVEMHRSDHARNLHSEWHSAAVGDGTP